MGIAGEFEFVVDQCRRTYGIDYHGGDTIDYLPHDVLEGSIEL